MYIGNKVLQRPLKFHCAMKRLLRLNRLGVHFLRHFRATLILWPLCLWLFDAKMDASNELQSTSGEGVSQPDQQFIFVTDYDRRFIRSRLMRNSWTQRNERNSQRPSLREHILPATRGIVPNHSAANSRSLPLRAEQQAAPNAQVGANHADLASLLDSFGLSEVENSRNILRFQAQSNGHDKVCPARSTAYQCCTDSFWRSGMRLLLFQKRRRRT